MLVMPGKQRATHTDTQTDTQADTHTDTQRRIHTHTVAVAFVTALTAGMHASSGWEDDSSASAARVDASACHAQQ